MQPNLVKFLKFILCYGICVILMVAFALVDLVTSVLAKRLTAK